MKRAVQWVLVLLLAGSFSRASAQERYVTDQLEITLRTGPGTGYRIVEMLASGRPVTRLEESEGWARVKTRSGKEGWVLARYLTNEPPKGPQLAVAQKELEALRAEREQLRGAATSASQDKTRLAEDLKRVREQLAATEKEFAAWKTANQDVLALGAKATALEQEQATTRAELEELRTANRSLQTRERFYWFFSGVVVLLLGWGLGSLYTSSRLRAKSQSKYRY